MTVLCEEIEYLALATLSTTLPPSYNSWSVYAVRAIFGEPSCSSLSLTPKA